MTDTPTAPNTGAEAVVLPQKETRTDHYEVLVLVTGSDDDATKTIINDVKTILEAGGATITLEDIWGTRNLAYTINKTKTGFYFVLEFDLTTDKIAEVNEKLRIRKDIARFMLVKKQVWTKEQLVDREQLRQNLLKEKTEDEEVQDKPERKPAAQSKPEPKPEPKPQAEPVAAAPAPKPTAKPTPEPESTPEPAKPEAAKTAAPTVEKTADPDSALADIDAKIDAILKDDLNI